MLLTARNPRCFALVAALTALSLTPLWADPISASYTGTHAPSGLDYGFTFTIEDLGGGTFGATLTNTSDPSSTHNDKPVIDHLAFNMDAVLGTDFDITDISPEWEITSTSGGVLFDYSGSASSQNAKLSPLESLTFNFVFLEGFVLPAQPYDLWTETASSLGRGIGGGNESGQVAVGFQGLRGEGALLTANWGAVAVPEPTAFLLLSSGLGALALCSRRRRLSRK